MGAPRPVERSGRESRRAPCPSLYPGPAPCSPRSFQPALRRGLAAHAARRVLASITSSSTRVPKGARRPNAPQHVARPRRAVIPIEPRATVRADMPAHAWVGKASPWVSCGRPSHTYRVIPPDRGEGGICLGLTAKPCQRLTAWVKPATRGGRVCRAGDADRVRRATQRKISAPIRHQYTCTRKQAQMFLRTARLLVGAMSRNVCNSQY